MKESLYDIAGPDSADFRIITTAYATIGKARVVKVALIGSNFQSLSHAAKLIGSSPNWPSTIA